ncbi:hypothetical protein MG296_09185 [Flavobacteriaceae bacterium TK19130]|nr:hypothetical protein [Thermobacterium salinum]
MGKDIFVMVCAILLAVQPQPMRNKPLVCAHRGYSNNAPENTLASIQKAIECGADFVEFDVRLTKDGKVVLLHDSTLDKTTNATGKLSDYSYSQLKNISAGYAKRFGDTFSKESIPTLSQALQLCKDRIYVEIEIKDSNMASKVFEIVQQEAMIDEVMIISFNYNELLEMRKLSSSIRLKYLVGEDWTEEALLKAKALGSDVVGIDGIPNFSQQQWAKKHQIDLFPYTLNSNWQLKTAQRLGLSGVTTDVPEKALQLFR